MHLKAILMVILVACPLLSMMFMMMSQECNMHVTHLVCWRCGFGVGTFHRVLCNRDTIPTHPIIITSPIIIKCC